MTATLFDRTQPKELRSCLIKDTVFTQADLLVLLVIKFKAVEADVVWIPPGG